jgi:hypothetical protein
MTPLSHNVWRPELELNGKYIAVRYLFEKDRVIRDVKMWHGQPMYFESEQAVGAFLSELSVTC